MTGLFERRNGRILRLICFVRELKIRENAVASVRFGLSEFLAVHRNNSFANFARRFGNQLFKPCAEIKNSGRSDDGNFVAAVIRRYAENCPKDHARICVCCGIRAACLHHFVRAFQELANIQTHRGGGNHTEIRKCGVASTDARNTRKNLPELVGLRNLLHFGAWVGHCDEAAANKLFADGFLHALEEILLENIRLKRAARFAGHDA